jgi:hypothetical protein
MVLVLLKCRDCRLLGIVGALFAVVGTLSSLSSGPWVALAVFGAAALLVRRPALVRPILLVLLLGCLAGEVGSNRRIYYLIQYVGFVSGTGWYRARLLEVALRKLPEYWLLGYGFQDPGWGWEIAFQRGTDVTNHFILLAVRGGVAATASFVAMLVVVMLRLRRVFLQVPASLLGRASWYLGSMTVAVALGGMSVALMDVESLFVVMVGVATGPAFVVPVLTRRVAAVRGCAGEGLDSRRFGNRISPRAEGVSPGG